MTPSELTAIRERDARMDEPGQQDFAAVAMIDRRELLAHIATLELKLQSERDENFTLNMTCTQLGEQREADLIALNLKDEEMARLLGHQDER